MVFSSEPALSFQEYNGHLITNANIKISDGIDDIHFKLDSTWRPCFRSTGGKARVGDTYTLEVSAPGFETIRSSVTVPAPVPITGASTYRLPPNAEAPDLYERRMKINLTDPPHERNFYAVTIVEEVYNYVMDWEASRAIFAVPTDETRADSFIPALFEEYKTGQSQILFFDDQFFNGTHHTLELGWQESERYNHVDGELEFRVNLWSVSEEYYNNRLTLQKQKDQMKDPFAQPVQVSTNIENGFGVFGAYSQSQIVLVNVE
jgi:hypothetical protein